MALLSGLVGGPSAPSRTGPDNPKSHRRRTFAALVGFFADRSMAGPFLLLVEDLHWCDPTTLEAMGELLERASTLPIMIVATTRAGHDHQFGDAPNLCRMTLPRLSRLDTKSLVAKMFGGLTVPEPMLEFITARTDGVPLFIEELAKAIRETGALTPTAMSLKGDEGLDFDAIPTSLQGILMERLDKLQAAKRVAQIAACIGRDFDLDVLGSVVDLSGDQLARALETLVASELVLAKSGVASGRFSFKHALVCDAAYSSLLFSERQKIHATIAAALDSQSNLTRPEILAYHLTNAQDIAPAIEKWREAAVAAKLRSANNEAIAHIGKAMRLLDQLGNPAERNSKEFSLLIELIAPYRATRGFAAREVAEVTERAILLADQAKDVRGVLPLLYNQWVYKFVTAHRDVCQELAESILARCDYDEDDLLRMTGLRALAATDFTRGRFEDAVERFEASIALYSAERQAEATQSIGLDALVVASGYNSLACWCLGRTQDAINSIERALAHARTVAHASTTAFAVYHHTLLMGVLERDAAVLRSNGQTLEATGLEQQFDMWTVCGRLLQSMGDCLTHTTFETLQSVIGHLADFQDMGLVYRPTYEAFIAEAWLRLGRREQGLVHVDRARRLMEESGELWSESEICRLEGELHLLHEPDVAKAVGLLEQAVAIARSRGARRFEARATESLSHVPPFGRPAGF